MNFKQRKLIQLLINMCKIFVFQKILSNQMKQLNKKQQLLALRDKTGFTLKLMPEISFPRMDSPLSVDVAGKL